MISEELERLQRLRATGVLSEGEFQQAKRQVLEGGPSAGTGMPPESQGYAPPPQPVRPVSAGGEPLVCGMAESKWCLLLHLSSLSGLLTGGLGWVAPIVMWVVSKDESVAADRHGRVILNWLLSSLVYIIAGVVLSFVLIGIPLLIAIAILSIVWPIMGAIKAADGVCWEYPLSIRFIDVESPGTTSDHQHPAAF